MSIDPKSSASYLLVRLDHMGDIVMSVPAILKSMRKSFPEAKIDLLTTANGGAVLGTESHADRVVATKPPWSVPVRRSGIVGTLLYLRRLFQFYRKSYRELQSEYDYTIFLSYSPWERLISIFIRGPKAGFVGPYRGLKYSFSKLFLDEKVSFDTRRHVLDNCFELVDRALGTRLARTQSTLRVDGAYDSIGSRLLSGCASAEPVVMIQAGSARSMKSWSYAGFLAVAEELEKKYGASCVFIGTAEEIDFQEEYCQLHDTPLPHRVVSRSMDDLIGLLSRADLFIANDGGPMHLASAMGIPTVAIFGPTDETVFGPKAETTLVVREGGICGRRHYPWSPSECCKSKNRECLRLAREETVRQAAEQLMERYALGEQ